MNQQEVLEWVLSKDCYIYEQRIKETGTFYYVRRNGSKKIATIFPTKDNRPYAPATICHICDTLGGIEKPEYAATHAKVVKEATAKAKVLNEYPNRNMN